MNEKEEFFYQLHSETREFKFKMRQAQAIISRGLEVMRFPYVSMSFGKDSTVMVHLLLDIKPHLPIVYVNCGEWDEWPDTARVKCDFLSRYPCNFIELSGPSIMIAYRSAGLYIQDEEETRAMRKVQRQYGDSLAEILDRCARWHGFDGSFIGLRKDECRTRLILFAMRGDLYSAKTRNLWACYPLIHWSGRDVWAYIVKHNLPYNDLYDLDPQGRERARNGAMFGTRSARFGRLSFMKEMYPDWFNRFAAEFPEVRCFI